MSLDVLMVLTEPPFKTNRFGEKLRMALGLTLNDDLTFKLLFLGDARHALADLDEALAGMVPISKNINILPQIGAKIFMESGGSITPSVEVETVEAASVESMLEEAHIVIT